MIFRAMLHRTIGYIFNHKKTRDVIERELIAFLEDPKTRKMFEKMLEQAILEYAKNSGYKL